MGRLKVAIGARNGIKRAAEEAMDPEENFLCAAQLSKRSKRHGGHLGGVAAASCRCASCLSLLDTYHGRRLSQNLECRRDVAAGHAAPKVDEVVIEKNSKTGIQTTFRVYEVCEETCLHQLSFSEGAGSSTCNSDGEVSSSTVEEDLLSVPASGTVLWHLLDHRREKKQPPDLGGISVERVRAPASVAEDQPPARARTTSYTVYSFGDVT